MYAQNIWYKYKYWCNKRLGSMHVHVYTVLANRYIV